MGLEWWSFDYYCLQTLEYQIYDSPKKNIIIKEFHVTYYLLPIPCYQLKNPQMDQGALESNQLTF